MAIGTSTILLTLTLRDNNDVVDQADLAMHARASEEHNGHHDFTEDGGSDGRKHDLALLGRPMRS
jgi:hypothetical protein